MNIAFVPIDNRPVCYTLPEQICAMDGNIRLYMPAREWLGDLTKYADVDKIFQWLKDLPKVDAIILSLDTVAYGGLISSRRSNDSFEKIKERIEKLKEILKDKHAEIYAFSSIMRISNNNYNEEEKEYWKDWGKKIFEYSYTAGAVNDNIPDYILKDYLETRKRNFEINKIYLKWQKEGLFDTLIFSKDDCAEKGLNVEEARKLEQMGGKTKTGADEIPLALLARAIKKEIKVYPKFLEPEYKECISNYEDVPVRESVLSQLELGGFISVKTEEEADIVLIVNNFIKKQGELVMGCDTEPYNRTFIPPEKPYCIADVRYANGSDNAFVKQLLEKIDMKYFCGYAGWNTTANTLGSLLAGIKVLTKAGEYNEKAFRRLQMIRFLDDWAYQANVRGKDLSLMNRYETKLQTIFGDFGKIEYSYPWNRSFEIEIGIK